MKRKNTKKSQHFLRFDIAHTTCTKYFIYFAFRSLLILRVEILVSKYHFDFILCLFKMFIQYIYVPILMPKYFNVNIIFIIIWIVCFLSDSILSQNTEYFIKPMYGLTRCYTFLLFIFRFQYKYTALTHPAVFRDFKPSAG